MPLYLNYYLWLLGVSIGVCALERFFSATPKQEFFRDGFGQDLFWLLFNVQYVSWMLAMVSVHLVAWINTRIFEFGLPQLDEIGLIATWPLSLQFLVVFVLKDFLEWNIHRVLHRVPWLWEFHKLHHSIERLDWLTTFRSHWGEIVLYKFIIYLPLVILGADHRVIFAVLIFGLVIQELAHANLKWDWGPLRFVLNSPRLHAWHHAVEMHGAGGQNFGVTLTVWDWMFGTIYCPGDGRRPSALGFDGVKQYPTGIWGRFWSPFTRRSRARKLRADRP